jgi:hypothetical protein
MRDRRQVGVARARHPGLRGSILLAAVLFALVPSAQAQRRGSFDAAAAPAAALGTASQGARVGTAFRVGNPHPVYVTAAHVVSGCRTLALDRPHRRGVTAIPVDGSDLALLIASSADRSEPWPLAGEGTVQSLADDQLVWTVGYPGGVPAAIIARPAGWLRVRGPHVSGEQLMLRLVEVSRSRAIEGPTDLGGFSGAPVVYGGALIGVFTAVASRRGYIVATQVAFGVPALVAVGQKLVVPDRSTTEARPLDPDAVLERNGGRVARVSCSP